MGVKKIGRPTNNPKGSQIAVRLDDKGQEILEAYCEKFKVSKSVAVRTAVYKLEAELKSE